MSDMSISGSLSSTGGVQSHPSETSGNTSAGKLSKDLKSVANSAEQTSEGLSRASAISCVPEGEPNIQPSACIRVLQVPGGRAQINQMGDSGNSGASTRLKINEPADPTSQTSEISGSGSPVILGDKSPETDVIDYVNSLKREFRNLFPESLITIKNYALGIVLMEKQLSHKNWDLQKSYFLNENMLARRLTTTREKYAESIRALSADWRIISEQN
ncbi:hypothetical protein [Citrobacter sp. Igbk 16]|uniref:hypothetical protein n=1 Tax=Citrobacter sp. Igbk 16 TaxID=2963958 RepID=UPI002303BA92|nr:hypothetical protein [Citrobacter sp. Igbk 16]MDA8517390.1 hypothetical protein [Citrobacter sp. Igbk 16]